jgi:undecaprenyl-diphosphatase
MTILQAIVLGIVQGLTEFLPISSSGHLLLVPWLFNWHFLLENPDLNKTFDVALHLGTFVAVVIYFWREIGRLIGAWVRSIARRSLAEPEGKLAWLLIVSTIPAALVGVAFEDFITNHLGKPWMIGVAMIVFAGFMYLIDHLAKLDRDLEALSWFDALLIGVAQALALLPGVSRSGITMMTGLLLRLDRESAARYSFLMSMAAAALSGIAAIWFVLAYLKRHNFNIFVIYRIVVGVGVIILVVAGVRSGMGI